MPFLRWLSDPFKWLSDLQLGDEKVTAWITWDPFFLGGAHVFVGTIFRSFDRSSGNVSVARAPGVGQRLCVVTWHARHRRHRRAAVFGSSWRPSWGRGRQAAVRGGSPPTSFQHPGKKKGVLAGKRGKVGKNPWEFYRKNIGNVTVRAVFSDFFLLTLFVTFI